ncbi:BapA/Bap/LapF family large adhesin [Sphingomonas sp. CLY1604]|uniref:BapA/Bap/LapF family large adhesin n=1 Tax=Sphingomonas sp. CLY1604 TaxID=3457786 RepID=UPI003FD804D1
MSAQIISKATGAVTDVAGNAIDLDTPSIVRLDLDRSAVAGFEREGHDLVIRLTNGEQIRIADFYPDNAVVANDLVLRDESGHQWLARVGGGTPRFSALRDLDEILAAEAHGGGSSLLVPALLGGVAAAGGIVALAAGGSDERDEGTSGQPPIPDPDTGNGAPDREAPAAPTVSVSANGTGITGRGEAGATVQVRDAAGTVVGTAVVAPDGSYTVTLSPAQTNGEPLRVTQTDAAGNVSAATPVAAPDLTAPGAPVAAIDDAGTSVRGTGEAGATVTVRDAAGTVIGSAVVAADGSYTVTLSPAAANGGTLSVVQTDAAGNASPPAALAAPDITAPATPTATVAGDGASVTGTGEAGARITIADANGGVIGSGTVAADGSFTVALSPGQANGETLSVRQTDTAGNASPALTVTAPDITAPAAPTVAIDASGIAVSGTGEPGARVTITDAAGTPLATASVGADGRYTATLVPPQVDGGRIDAIQTDAAGNASGSASTIAPDLTAPAQPTAAIAGDGASVTGTGEAGARITVTGADGTALGTATVGADGSYAATLSPTQANGQALTVVQTDAAGNASTPLALVAPDITAPAAPAATLDASGTVVTGSGEPGAGIVVRDAAGTTIGTAQVGAQGQYTVILANPQVDGQALTVTQADAAGNVSPQTPLTAPDATAPAAPVAAVSADGATVTGTGEAGATVTVRDPVGAVIGTATVGADGSYSVPLAPPQVDGEVLDVRQADAAGNVSPPATAAAPDLTIAPAPDAPTASVTADGGAVIGTAAAGALVTLYAADGTVIGSAAAAGDGAYTIALAPPRIDGETIRVTQTDAAGAVSPPATALAPDLTAPAAPSAVLDPAGTVVTGRGEAGATIVVRDADGTIVGTATANGRGDYATVLDPAQADGGTIAVTQADAAGNVSAPTQVAVPDLTAPLAPVAAVGADGSVVTGTGEPGATVTVRDPAGAAIGSGTVAADGSYAVALLPAQANGGSVSVTLTDAAGNVSPATAAAAPDVTAPAAPTAAVAGDGASVVGLGEPGARITVTDAAGTPIGTAVAGADGRFVAPLDSPQANGETIRVVQTDAAGNASPPLTLAAPDITAPGAPAATLDGTGSVVTGTGEPGATVSVAAADGTVLGSATVTAQGSYTIVLATPQVDSQPIAVTQTDAAGNTSAATGLVAPDLTAPAAPTASVAGDGTAVTGTGEVGATVTVRDPLGLVIGTAVVEADGRYTAAIAPAQTDGEQLTVRQSDIAGNVSAPAAATAPDLVADRDPDAPTAAVAADGTAVTGAAMAGAAITVYDADGAIVATGVAGADGSYSVALAPPRIDGETVRVTQTDGDGDVSPPATAIAPDLTAPAAPVAALDATGSVVTGSGEPGATVTVRAADGTPLGTATVTAGGAFAVPLGTTLTNGEALSVTQADAAGNVSPATPVLAPDFTAPLAPTAIVSADGAVVTGSGEPGATVMIAGPDGTMIGSALVAADGSYSATLATPQRNGETLTVTQADPAGNASPGIAASAPDLTAPAAPTLAIAADGTAATGTGEPGATVTVTAPDGTPLGTAVVAADGSFTVPLAPATVNGETLGATQSDAAGNISPAATALAPDLVAPAAPTATVAADGASVTGTGEPNARIVIVDGAGTVVGIAIVDAGGSYVATLDPPQIDGDTLTATQTDAGGNVSPGTAALAPDLVAPAAPTLVVADDGASASGTGEPGATVTLRNPDGSVIATAPVAADGSYTIALVPPRLDGELLSVTQADAAGNVSPPATDAAPDTTAPDAPVAGIDAGGTTVTGTGEPGATVTVTGPAGALGTAVVAADGSFTVPLATAQANGEALTVVQADAAGNASPATSLAAPDITAPAAPTATVAADGASVSGQGEPGATVTITAPGGAPIGSAVVAADGSYTAALDTPRTNGELLGASQRDPAGNPSGTTSALAPDTTAPAAPAAAVSADGGFVIGTGEPGARVTVTGPGGTLGTALVAPDGSYAVPLTTPQTDGQTLTVVQADRAGNVSPPASPVAPDLAEPPALTAAVTADGAAVTGTGLAGASVTVTAPGGVPIGTATVAADGSYTVVLDVAQRNGELLNVVQTDGAGIASPPVPALAPDLTAPAAPTASVGADGGTVAGLGEPGATVTVTAPGGGILGSAVVGADGGYLVTLATPQRNGEALVATQADAAGNVSAPANAAAPDLTAPPAPTALVVSGDGTTLSGAGEAGARVEVRGAGNVLLGSGTVAADGSFTLPLAPAQASGGTLVVTQADAAGNVSDPASIVAPFDIAAFDNADTVTIDLVPGTTPVNYGTANYVALVSLGALNLQAEVLAVPAIRFEVAAGHSLDAVFTYDALLDLGVASGYAVVVQRLEGTQWVAVSGTGPASLLDVGLLNGNLSATETLGPGEYRAFLTFQGTAGVGLLGSLNVAGVDSDFTDIAAATPGTATGNVITDAGPAGEVDVTGPGTRVASVTVNGVTTAVAAGGTVIDGAWGTLTINPDGSYSYTPDATPTGIGQTDSFTYTLLDPTDGETESATLSIAIGSPDITGVPVAVADQAVAAVTYANVETSVPVAPAFTFGSQPGGLLLPSTGAGSGSFTVAPDATADLTITAVRQPNLSLSLLPSYTLTVRDAGGATVFTETRASLAGLPIGTGVSFTLDDLPSGTYSYTVSSRAALGTFGTTVSLGSTTTFLDAYTLATRETAEGNLFANDTAHTPFAILRVDSGSGFAEVGDTPVTLTGRYGTLTVDEAGGYVYQPIAALGYSATDLTDSFTYQLAQPGGSFATATLTVTIDVPADGSAAAPLVTTQVFAVEADVIPLDALTAHVGVAAADAPVATATGLATYDLFEGRGELEDVLSHYLATQPQDGGTTTAESAHAAVMIDAPLPPVVDPLDYLVTLPDQDHIGNTVNHGV